MKINYLVPLPANQTAPQSLSRVLSWNKVRHLVYLTCPICLLGVLLLSGCTREDKISSYKIPKREALKKLNPGQSSVSQQPIASGPATDGMLAAIVPYGSMSWFFKVSGPIEQIDQNEEAFRQFLQTVKFDASKDPKPQWTLPDQWKQLPGSGMRYATLQFGSEEKPLELTVIPLPLTGEKRAHLLSNINRWRGQLSLTPLAEADLAANSIEIELSDTTATMVTLHGHLSKNSSMGQPPFASGGPFSRSPVASPPSNTPQPPPAAGVPRFTASEVWTQGKVGGFRKASYTVSQGDQQVDISLIDLAAAAWQPLPNVNRWRGQVQLGPMTQEALDRAMTKINVGPLQGDYIELIGPDNASRRESILAVIVVHGDRSWFFKLKGSSKLAEQEKQRFLSFVQSAKFPEQGEN